MFNKLFIGRDHTGEKLEVEILNFAQSKNLQIEVVRMREDYVDVAESLTSLVLSNPLSCGILICGSGVGVSIAANRFSGIRAALCHSVETAKLARLHNNSNVLCLGARLLPEKDQLEIVEAFLESEFEGGRHEIRISKIK